MAARHASFFMGRARRLSWLRRLVVGVALVLALLMPRKSAVALPLSRSLSRAQRLSRARPLWRAQRLWLMLRMVDFVALLCVGSASGGREIAASAPPAAFAPASGRHGAAGAPVVGYCTNDRARGDSGLSRCGVGVCRGGSAGASRAGGAPLVLGLQKRPGSSLADGALRALSTVHSEYMHPCFVELAVRSAPASESSFDGRFLN